MDSSFADNHLAKPKAGALSRRALLASLAVAPLAGRAIAAPPTESWRWVRPGQAGWPTAAQWASLSAQVDGRLAPAVAPDLKSLPPARLANPYFRGDEPGLTQSFGWIDAWKSAPSAWVLKAKDAQDVARTVRFAAAHNVRLVVKGGGHSYLGGSNAPDSLLIWTRAMDQIELHDAFTPAGAGGPGVPAVSVGAGCTWGHVYDAVTTKGGRYVQGGGCTTVGVAGLVQGGGFGSFSKAYGLAAASLLEAEIVTADGRVRVVSEAQEPDLFWALKGGGGGTFGVVTRLTLKTHDLPQTFGAAFGAVKAATDADFRRLLERFLAHAADKLINPHWGEQARATHANRLELSMVFQGLSQAEAQAVWAPFQAFVAAEPAAFYWAEPLRIGALPAQRFWDAEFIDKALPGVVARDERPDAPRSNWWWAGDGDQAGAMWRGYQSAWLPKDLLEPGRRPELAAAWLAASRRWSCAFHFNKGLAGASHETLAASRRTAMNPQVLDAFALAIIAGDGAPAWPDEAPAAAVAEARDDAREIRAAMDALRVVAPGAGCYLSECDYFLQDWRRAAWGPHAARLEAIKRRYDPHGMFVVHHGVGGLA